MKKIVLFTIGILIGSIISTNAHAQTCGTTKYGSITCLDYKGRTISNSYCDGHTSQIGSRPTPVPSKFCPEPCPPPPPPPPPTPDPTPTPSSCGTLSPYEYETRELGCPANQSGTNRQQYRRSQSYKSNCDIVRGTWEATANTFNNCSEPGSEPAPATCIETNTHDGVVKTTEKPEGTCSNTTTCTVRTRSEEQQVQQNCEVRGSTVCGPTYDDWGNVTNPNHCYFRPTYEINVPSTRTVTQTRTITTNSDCSESTGPWSALGTYYCAHEGDRNAPGDD